MINLVRCHQGLLFFFSLFSFLIFPVIWPTARFFFFVPFLVVSFYQSSYLQSLWLSLFCGIIVDMFSVHAFFGWNAFTYMLTTAILYPKRCYFFADRLTTLPLMTFFFSSIITLFLIFGAEILEGQKLLSWKFVYTDLIVMPIFDALYAFAWVVLPLSLSRLIRFRARQFRAR